MLFDTDVIIWALRGDIRAADVIDQADRLDLSVVSYEEYALKSNLGVPDAMLWPRASRARAASFGCGA